jgi:predicted HTH domain antitoxin
MKWKLKVNKKKIEIETDEKYRQVKVPIDMVTDVLSAMIERQEREEKEIALKDYKEGKISLEDVKKKLK